MSRANRLLRRAWWSIHSRFMDRAISTPKMHICWWGATLGQWRGYYVVLNWHAYDGPHFYVSPNGTPWHHAARSLFTGRLMSDRCSCAGCQLLTAIEHPEQVVSSDD